MKHLYRITFLIVLILIDLFLTNLISESHFLYENTEENKFVDVDSGQANALVINSNYAMLGNLPRFIKYSFLCSLDNDKHNIYMIPKGKEAEIRKAARQNSNSNYNFQVQYLSKGTQFFDVRFETNGSTYRFRYLVIDNKIYPIYFGHSTNPKLAKLVAFLVATFITYGFRLIIALLIHLHDLSMRKEKEIHAISKMNVQ